MTQKNKEQNKTMTVAGLKQLLIALDSVTPIAKMTQQKYPQRMQEEELPKEIQMLI